MATNKFITLVEGVRRLVTAIGSSSGAADANKIVATDGTGKLNISLLPSNLVTTGAGGTIAANQLPPSIVYTTANGTIAPSQLPANIGERTDTVQASEALSPGNFVNYWVDSGTRKVRKADSTNNRPAHGFVLASIASGANATVYLEGRNTALSGLTAGVIHFLSTSGAASTTAPANDASGAIVQELGFAYDSGSLTFEYDGYTVIA